MPLSSRLAVRLAKLPHDALAEFAAQLCADDSAAAAQAEALLAAHDPVPQWAVEGVLLSSDLRGVVWAVCCMVLYGCMLIQRCMALYGAVWLYGAGGKA